jgi:hypothetical protein
MLHFDAKLPDFLSNKSPPDVGCNFRSLFKGEMPTFVIAHPLAKAFYR